MNWTSQHKKRRTSVVLRSPLQMPVWGRVMLFLPLTETCTATQEKFMMSLANWSMHMYGGSWNVEMNSCVRRNSCMTGVWKWNESKLFRCVIGSDVVVKLKNWIFGIEPHKTKIKILTKPKPFEIAESIENETKFSIVNCAHCEWATQAKYKYVYGANCHLTFYYFHLHLVDGTIENKIKFCVRLIDQLANRTNKDKISSKK